MIVIIDGGSTKADWIFSDGHSKTFFTTTGMNPCHLQESDIVNILQKEVQVKDLSKVFFFGAGCTYSEDKVKIINAFRKIYKDAVVEVENDVMGAALATCGDQPGIACILGTGCNSVYFDGQKVLPNNYGLGFILSDEGAGVDLGKKLITSYLYGLLPENLSTQFKSKYNLTRDVVIKNVYNNPTANTWIASFAQFLSDYKNDEWVINTVKSSFKNFINLFVLNYENHANVPVHFIGSIAFNYKNLLVEVLDEKKLFAGKFIQKPIDDLADFIIAKHF
jgi:N-acetylglucosamine kinase-like BadF-type ATPase